MAFHVEAKAELREFYRILFSAWGRQHWWPAQSRFEVIVGAYLTQNTSWSNVEKALGNLRRAGALHAEAVRRATPEQLEAWIRSAGYFRQKARRLKLFVEYLDAHYGGSLDRMFAQPTSSLREELLQLNGVGPETADSILLYAGNHPVFVVDAYTRRILGRHGLLPENASYEDIRSLCEQSLGAAEFTASCATPVRGAGSEVLAGPRSSCHPPSRMSRGRRSPVAQVYNEMHGLLVGVAKKHRLKAAPQCDGCPLAGTLRGESAPSTRPKKG